MRKLQISGAIVSLLLLTLLVGCGGSPAYIGTWESKLSMGPVTLPGTLDIKADKTASLTIDLGAKIIMSGTWIESEPGVISITYDSTKIEGELSAGGAMIQGQIEKLAEANKGKVERWEYSVLDDGSLKTKNSLYGDVVWKKKATTE